MCRLFFMKPLSETDSGFFAPEGALHLSKTYVLCRLSADAKYTNTGNFG